MAQVLTLVEFSEVQVETVLAQEEQRPNYAFIARDSTVLEAENKFAANNSLEALFITQHGKSNQVLLGIITRWDLLTLTNSG